MRGVSTLARVALLVCVCTAATAQATPSRSDDGVWLRLLRHARSFVAHVLDEISVPKG